MRIHELETGLAESGRFAATIENGLILVTNLETDSEYAVEEFDGSFQVRQAICFDCLDGDADELLSLHILCSMTNRRFSGCKLFVDRWGALVMASDVLGTVASVEFVEIILDQVEFMSQAIAGLVERIHEGSSAVTDEELDSALESPSLQ